MLIKNYNQLKELYDNNYLIVLKVWFKGSLTLNMQAGWEYTTLCQDYSKRGVEGLYDGGFTTHIDHLPALIKRGQGGTIFAPESNWNYWQRQQLQLFATLTKEEVQKILENFKKTIHTIMSIKNKLYDFKPNWAIHPGEDVKEFAEYRGWSNRELAKRMGVHENTITNLINGKDRITQDLAQKLAKIFDMKASFWMNAQAIYDESLPRQKKEEEKEVLQSKIK